MLETGRRMMNRVARMTCGEWDWERTRQCYVATGWLTLHQMAIYKTYTMARKVISNQGPVSILDRMTYVTETGLREMRPVTTVGTEMARRSFSNRTKRLWAMLTEEEKQEKPEEQDRSTNNKGEDQEH